MVEIKFEKRLRAEIVPEWRTKYIDYKGLKKRLRHIKQTKSAREMARSNHGFTVNSRPHSPDVESSSLHGQSIQSQQRTFSMASSFFHKVSSALASVQKLQNLHAPPPQISSLDTLMDQVEPEERLFFAALDKELAKIETFCEVKEKEAINRMNVLVQQHEILKKEKAKQHYRRGDRNTKTFVKQSFEYLRHSAGNFEKYSSEKQYTDYQTARKIIKKAVFEFYRSVELLKNYCALNYTGFAKILKKYDTISERNGYKVYMQKVTKWYTPNSKTVKNLLKEAEDFYVADFEGGSRSRALRKLRMPNKEHKTYYSSVLRVGLCLGLALPVAITSLIIVSKTNLRNMSQLYGGLVLPIFLLLLAGVNMYIWTKSRINYRFIFELNPRNNLDYRQYFELPAIILLVISCTMLLNFLDKDEFFQPLMYPIFFAIFTGVIVFNPFPILYYNARRWFILSIGRLFGSGFLRVEFRDFFIADCLTSLSYSLTMFQLFGRDVTTNPHKYNVSTSKFTPFLGSIPAALRLLQCLKRYRDTHQVHHLINLFKYLSSILAIFMASSYNRELCHKMYYIDDMKNLNCGDKMDKISYNKNVYTAMLFLWMLAQSFASIYTFSWDVKMDWSLFKLHSVNYLLRDELGYEYHWIYYCAIAVNFLLRWNWIFAIICRPPSPRVGFFIAFGEMFRRWLWNFFRVENEHIQNCEQNRAVKEIPLPYQTEEVIIPDFDTIYGTDLESDFDRASLTSWRRKLFTSKKSVNSADSLRDFEPRRDAQQYMYEDIYEESDDESDGYGEDENSGTNANRLSVVRLRDHGLNNAYASRSFLPSTEADRITEVYRRDY